MYSRSTEHIENARGMLRKAAKQRFLLLLAVLVFPAAGCRNYYRQLRPASADAACITKFRPDFTNTLYSAYVDVTKHHFSGLLLLRKMPDNSTRVVFTNEMGIKFFDFSFGADGTFKTYYVLPKMNKKVVVNALRKDLELAMLRADFGKATILSEGDRVYYRFPDKKGHDFFITQKCDSLVRIEKASRRKPIEEIYLMNYRNNIPDSISIRHKNFKFNISLKRAERQQ